MPAAVDRESRAGGARCRSGGVRCPQRGTSSHERGTASHERRSAMFAAGDRDARSRGPRATSGGARCPQRGTSRSCGWLTWREPGTDAGRAAGGRLRGRAPRRPNGWPRSRPGASRVSRSARPQPGADGDQVMTTGRRRGPQWPWRASKRPARAWPQSGQAPRSVTRYSPMAYQSRSMSKAPQPAQ